MKDGHRMLSAFPDPATVFPVHTPFQELTMTVKLSPNALTVLEKRYLKKDQQGRIIETPEEMFHRVARAVAEAESRFHPDAEIEATKRKFERLLTRKWFIPNSPTLINAGRPPGQLASCFVLPIEDSLDSIFESLKHAALIHKSGGGTGFSFSRLRPENDVVLSSTGISGGPVTFMKVFDAATDAIKQGGIRRGANMGVLRVDHPDIESFIQSKNEPGRLTNFNISVALTQQFMDCLDTEKDFDLINPRTGACVRRISARKLFETIVDSAWKTGEPGVLFIDKINRSNPTPLLGEMEATNPCGEQPLLPYESCTLGSINLAEMVENATVNFTRLRDTVHMAVHFLDNVIEVNRYPLDVIEAATKRTRKIGIGVMGFADLLIQLGLPYDSEDSLQQAERIMSFISSESRKASAMLAQKRGNFPAFSGSIFDLPSSTGRRNATTTTVAPTGTLSIIAGTSSGIEPIFAVAYTRRVLDGIILSEIHPAFIRIARDQGFFSRRLIEEISETGTVSHIHAIPDSVKRLFKASYEIPIEWHIRIQAAFQKHTDNAVSKTINFPAHATRRDIETAFISAYRHNCKGITIYRYGSRKGQVLNIGRGEPAVKQQKDRCI